MNSFKLAEVGWRLTVQRIAKFDRNVQNCEKVRGISSSIQTSEKSKICVVGAGPGK